MEQTIGLNAAQMEFLQLLGRIKTEEELSELRKVVCDYYARKIDEEMDQLWESGQFDEKRMKELRGSHFRTPYNK